MAGGPPYGDGRIVSGNALRLRHTAWFSMVRRTQIKNNVLVTRRRPGCGASMLACGWGMLLCVVGVCVGRGTVVQR